MFCFFIYYNYSSTNYFIIYYSFISNRTFSIKGLIYIFFWKNCSPLSGRMGWEH